MAKRIKVGDIFSFPVANGFVFIQYLGKHSLMGECVLCCKADAINDADFGKGRILFYPVKLNVNQGNIEFVMHTDLLASVPEKIRRPFVLNRKVLYWFIDTPNETKKVIDLSEEQREYPIGTGLSHVVLKEIFEGTQWFLFSSDNFVEKHDEYSS
jgi:hypothetical protein